MGSMSYFVVLVKVDVKIRDIKRYISLTLKKIFDLKASLSDS